MPRNAGSARPASSWRCSRCFTQRKTGPLDPRRRERLDRAAISAAAPAIVRSSMRRWRPAAKARATASPTMRRVSHAGLLRSTAMTCSSASQETFFRGAGDGGLARGTYTRGIPMRCWSAARPMSDCGSPSSCATFRRSSGSAACRAGAIETATDAVTFGAAVTLEKATPYLAAIDPDLGELLRRFASVQIRNVGTIGGNIANGSPIGDTPPALIALGATLTLQRGAATRDCRWRISSSLTASRIARPANSCAPCGCRSSSRTNISAATRSPSASTRTFPA